MVHKKEQKNTAKHLIMMALACIIPLAIILFLSFFGITNKLATISSIALMAVLHVIIMKDHFLDKNKLRKGGVK